MTVTAYVVSGIYAGAIAVVVLAIKGLI